MVNVNLSAFSDEYADSFEEQLVGMNAYGIKYIELRHADKRNVSILDKDEVAEIKAKLNHYGISVSAIGSPLGKIRLDEDMDAHMETAKRVFETANTLGTKLVRVFSFYAPDGKDVTQMKEQVLDGLGRMLDVARSQGVTLCHENEAKIYGDTPARCRELLDHFGGELKCVFDMGNFVLEGVEPWAAYQLLRPDVAYFHIKDGLAAGAIVPPGCGEAKIKEILTAHREYAKEDFFTALEPHLQLFSGLHALVGRSFENPYQYESKTAAFTDAVAKFRELI